MSKSKFIVSVITILSFILYAIELYKFHVEFDFFSGVDAILLLIIYFEFAKWFKEVE